MIELFLFLFLLIYKIAAFKAHSLGTPKLTKKGDFYNTITMLLEHVYTILNLRPI